jgi:DNA-binding NarL/FixJ family response regulator
MAADRGVLRVVFAEDNYLVRRGTAALLAEVPEVELVRLAEEPQGLMAAVEELEPDAVLTDIRMPPTHSTEGIDAARRIRAEHPGTGVVVLSQYVEPQYARDLFADGVGGLGYLLKERIRDVDELVRALQEVCRGGSALDPKVVEALMADRSARGPSALTGLTGREVEVLRQMATGRGNSAIARSMYLSERAVEKHISAVFSKLGLAAESDMNRRVVAVLTFLEAGG